MTKNFFFGSLDHSKMHFCDLCMLLHDLVILPKVGKHLVLSQYAVSSRSNRPNRPKPLFWLLGSFKNAFSWFLNDSEWPGNLKLKNIKYYRNMQYQVDPKDQTPENDQNTPFWLFGPFKNAFSWFLNDLSRSGNLAESCETLSTITVCNIKSIKQTTLQKMA